MLERKNKVLSGEDTKALKFIRLWSIRSYINNRKTNTVDMNCGPHAMTGSKVLFLPYGVCVCERERDCVCVCVWLSCSAVSTLCNPMDCSPPGARQTGSSVYRISQSRYWSGLSFPSLRDLPDSGIEPGSPERLLHNRQVLLALSHWRWMKCKLTSHHWNKILGYIANFYMVCFTCEFNPWIEKAYDSRTSPSWHHPSGWRAGLLLGQDWVRPQRICTGL